MMQRLTVQQAAAEPLPDGERPQSSFVDGGCSCKRG